MRGVDNQHVDVFIDECCRPLQCVLADADGCGDPEPALVVLRGDRILDPLLDVLDGDQALQVPGGVDDGKLLDPVPAEDRPGSSSVVPTGTVISPSLVIRFAIGCWISS